MMQMIAVIAVGAGIALGIYGFAKTRTDRSAAMRELLESELDRPTMSPQGVSDLMERAGAFTERALGHTPTAGKLRVKLLQVGSSLKAGEFGAMLLLGTVLTFTLAFLLFRSPLVAIAAAFSAAVLVMARLNAKARKRIAKLESQLPEVLQLIAGSLDSGTSLLLALELAGEEGEAPLSSELARVVTECSVGRPLLESLDAMSDRIGSKDITWTVKAIRIQYQTGGKLADTLRILADFMGARLEVRGEIKALSAEARISGKILIAMPIGLAGFFMVARREYLEPLFTTAPGKVLITGAATGLLIGHLWMRKLVQLDI